MKSFKLAFLLLIISIPAFSTTYPISVENVLQKSGKNRIELLKVLDHYSSDSLKYKAACFLIENMDIHSSGSYYWADVENKKVEFDELSYPNFETSVKSFNAMSAQSKLHPVAVRTPDIEAIHADYLIRNIDKAFELKNTSWSKDLSFNQFCEYLLPYRILSEPFADWRDEYKKECLKYYTLDQGLEVRNTCTLLSNNLRKWFFHTYELNTKKEASAFLSPSQILFRRQGTCEDMANWGAYLLRSIGIAATVDFTPAWATSTGAHYWNVAFRESGTAIPFLMGDDNPDEFLMVREPSKVFRITYGAQPATLAAKEPENEIPEGSLRKQNYEDVTRDYWKVAHLPVKLNPFMPQQKNVFVSVFNGLRWKPVWWSSIIHDNADFSDLACGVVYLPMYYVNQKLVTASSPCILHADGSVQVLTTNETMLRTVKIEQQKSYLLFRPGKKYTLYYWKNHWKKVGEQIAGIAQEFLFENVPANSLMLLIPEYSQGKERPFTLDNKGIREWW